MSFLNAAFRWHLCCFIMVIVVHIIIAVTVVAVVIIIVIVAVLVYAVIIYLLMPFAPSGAKAINDPPPSHSVLGCSCHSGPVGPLLFQLCFSVSPPTVARPASLLLPLRVPRQGLACGAGCWLPEGMSDPALRPPQYLLGHWFPSRSLPQIFISHLLLPLDFVDAPQTGVEECWQIDTSSPIDAFRRLPGSCAHCCNFELRNRLARTVNSSWRSNYFCFVCFSFGFPFFVLLF